LIDALRFGRPAIATDTPAIREVAGPSVSLVQTWSQLDEGVAALTSLANRERREQLGRRGAEAWSSTFSAEALAPQLGAFVQNARGADNVRA
jgi:glycosyltransferase involved in cell wall biosynthesis